jgi:hypothetical protein
MPSRSERRYRVVGYGFLVVLVLLAALPGYLTLDQRWRPVALRVTAALLVAYGCMRIVGRVRRSLDSDSPSALDAPPPAPRAPARDERFLRLRDDIVFSRASQRYFHTIVWPRLVKLGGADLVPPPARRGLLRGGPSLRALERVVAEIERGTIDRRDIERGTAERRP